MHCKNIRFAIILAAGAGFGQANAFVWTFSDSMSGAQEVPPNASPATGTAFGTYDDVTNMLDFSMTFSGLVAPQTAAHIHTAPPGVNGPVTFPLPNGQVANFMTVMNATQEADFLAGNMYVNVHTTQFPGGEIRAQLHPVPEPATLLALVGGLGLLVARRRKS